MSRQLPYSDQACVDEHGSRSHMVTALQSRIEKMAAYFGRQCGMDPDDLCQEAWIAVLEMLPHVDAAIGAPEQHLLKRARWRILDTIRHQRRRRHLPLADVPPQMLSYPAPKVDLDLKLLCQRLTDTQRQILSGLLDGYTWREVGAQIGCTSANVAYHVRKIREVYLRLAEE